MISPDPASSEFDHGCSHGRYFLTNHAYCCEFEDGAVILDLKNDAYISLNTELVEVLQACVVDWPGSGTASMRHATADSLSMDSLVHDLRVRGILATDPGSRPFRVDGVSPAAVTAGNHNGWSASFELCALMRFVVAWITARRRMRRGLAACADLTYRHRVPPAAASRRPSPARIEDLLGSFFHWRTLFYTAHGNCLFDSLVLSIYLTRASVAATLMIGVSVKPFTAHSWVQIEDVVLNDNAEHVISFNPILAIR